MKNLCRDGQHDGLECARTTRITDVRTMAEIHGVGKHQAGALELKCRGWSCKLVGKGAREESQK